MEDIITGLKALKTHINAAAIDVLVHELQRYERNAKKTDQQKVLNALSSRKVSVKDLRKIGVKHPQGILSALRRMGIVVCDEWAKRGKRNDGKHKLYWIEKSKK